MNEDDIQRLLSLANRLRNGEEAKFVLVEEKQGNVQLASSGMNENEVLGFMTTVIHGLNTRRLRPNIR